LAALLRIWKYKNYGQLIKAKNILPARHSTKSNSPHALSGGNASCGEDEITKFSKIYEKKDIAYYCWDCQRCNSQRRFVKYENGSRACQKCGMYKKSNNARTRCVDKYTKHYLLSEKDWTGKVLLFLSVLLILFIMLCAFIFIRNIETPVVRSSDIKLSFMLLTGHLMVVVFLCFMFFGLPTPTKCLLRPYFFGIPFTFIKALHISKLQKFLMIFYAKNRITKRGFCRIRQIEALIVVVLLIISVFIVAMTQLDSIPMASYVERKLENKHLHYCTGYPSPKSTAGIPRSLPWEIFPALFHIKYGDFGCYLQHQQ